MKTMCYMVKINSAVEKMFEELNDYGFDYSVDEDFPKIGYMEISIDCYPSEIRDLEDIMKWYV